MNTLGIMYGTMPSPRPKHDRYDTDMKRAVVKDIEELRAKNESVNCRALGRKHGVDSKQVWRWLKEVEREQ